MAISFAKIGVRLRVARETGGMSARVVSGKLQAAGFRVSHATVCNYETGKATPSWEILTALCNVYGLSTDWLLGEGSLLTGIRYRCLKSVGVGEKRVYEGEALRWFQAYLAAEDALKMPLKSILPRFRVLPHETGKHVAQRVRKLFQYGNHPVPSVVRQLEEFGVRVIHLATSSRIDEFAGYLGDNPVVVVNPSLSNDRIRFNVAHALGHHLFKDCCTEGGCQGQRELETRAHEFASHLLIPEEMLAAAFELKSMVRLVEYKERFGISLAAMIYRARKASLLPQSLYVNLWKEFGRLGWRQEEPGYVTPDRPMRMEALFDAAVRQNKMTYRDIAQLAGVSETDVRVRVMRAMGGALEEIDGRRNPQVINLAEYRRELSENEGE